MGDTILFGKYAGCEVTGADEEHLLMREEDVLDILQERRPGGGKH